MPFPTRSITRFLPGILVAASVAAPTFAAPDDGHDHGHDHGVKAPAQAAPAAAKPAPAPKPVKLPAGVVAQVNGQNITRAEMLSTLDRFGGQPLLRQMITQAIIEQEAKRLGVTVPEAEINKSVAEAKQSIVSQAMMQGTPMTFEQIAARDGITEGLLRWGIRQQLLAQKAFAKTVEKNVPSIDGQIRASHILIATVPLGGPESKPLTEDEAKKKIDGILADVRSGKTKFADAAKASSDDKGSGAQGGQLGWFGKGMMDPAFEQAAFALQKPGDITEPVKSQYGWHIIQLEKRGADATAAEKAEWRKNETDRMVQNPQGIRAWMADLTNKANITTNPQAVSTAAPASRPATAAKPAGASKNTSKTPAAARRTGTR